MITLSRAIYKILSENTEVTALVGTSIYPVVTPQIERLPCIVFERASSTEGSKDGISMFEVNLNVIVISKDYDNGIDIAVACNNALNEYSGTVAGTQIIRARLTQVAEDAVIDAYFQKLTFNIKCR